MRSILPKLAFLILLSNAILAGQTASSAAQQGNAGPTGPATTTVGQVRPDLCNRSYRDASRGMSCQGLFNFQSSCPGELYQALATSALRLRCPDELLEQKIKTMRQEFATLEQRPNCAAATSLVDRYGADFELADAPELEKANVLRIRLCEQEMRAKELAALEASLREVIVRNDCAALKAFEKEKTLKLSPDQSNRLTTAISQRCDFEDQTRAALRSCLDKSDAAGNFCGGATCYRSFRDTLAESYFAPYRADADRRTNICNQNSAMRSCFSNDPCDGDRCSLPLRLAVGSGVLMSYIERSEKDAAQACSVKRDRERQAREQAEQEARRRQEELRAEERRNNTYKLTICNASDQSKIFVALSYYDYDADNWVREGWWNINRGDCSYVGDRFKRGNLYWYANGPGGRWEWKGDFGICTSSSRFRNVASHTTCNKNVYHLFRHADISDSEFTLRFH